jgi:hypothetical protein
LPQQLRAKAGSAARVKDVTYRQPDQRKPFIHAPGDFARQCRRTIEAGSGTIERTAQPGTVWQRLRHCASRSPAQWRGLPAVPLTARA